MIRDEEIGTAKRQTSCLTSQPAEALDPESGCPTWSPLAHALTIRAMSSGAACGCGKQGCTACSATSQIQVLIRHSILFRWL